MVPVALAIIATILLILAVFVFRSKIKNWLYKKSSEIYAGRNSGAPSIASVYSDNTKLFDIYVSYSVRYAQNSTKPRMTMQGLVDFDFALSAVRRMFWMVKIGPRWH